MGESRQLRELWCFSLIRDNSSYIICSVFKPKDEEPYGRLNPKVRVFIIVQTFTQRFSDYQVATSAI
jgi:hypothetical protein